MNPRLTVVVAVALSLSACPPPPVEEADAGPVDAGASCVPGAGPSGSGACSPVLPAGECPAGSMGLLGEAACQPVGPSCDGGFRPASDGGFGCEAVLPAESCDGGLATPGATSCASLGDCAGPFPPAAAAYFVDASLDAGALDATHFSTISAALAAAPVGATVAVEAGTYVEALVLRRAVTVVGRCAGKVVVASPGGTAPGLDVRAKNVTVEGLTLTGHRGGAVVVGSTSLTARACDFTANRDLGIAVFNAPAKVTLERSVVRRTRPMAGGTLGRGLEIEGGATAVLSGSLVEDNAEIGVFATDTGSGFTLRQSVVRGTRPSGDGTLGRGVYVKAGASGVVDGSALVRNHEVGAYAAGAGTTLTITGSSIEETLPPPALTYGRGVSANDGAVLTLEGSTARGNVDTAVEVSGCDATLSRVAAVDTRSTDGGDYGVGLFVKGPSSTTVSGSVFAGNRSSGLVTTEASATLHVEASLVTDTLPEASMELGYGVLVGGGTVSLKGVTVRRSTWAGLIAVSGSLTGHRVLVSEVATTPTAAYGHGVAAINTGTFELSDSLIERSVNVGFLCASACVMRGGWVRDNFVGAYAWGDTVLSVGEPPATGSLAGTFVLSQETVFDGNAARFGTAFVPIPPTIAVTSKP